MRAEPTLAVRRSSLAACVAFLLLAAGCEDGTAPGRRGSLALVVAGLPAGVNADVSVSGPSGFTEAVTTSRTLRSLAPGNYTITALDVQTSSERWTASPAAQTAAVDASIEATATVTYTLVPLALDLQLVVEGLVNPVFLTAPPGDPRLFIVERPGRIRIVRNGQLLPTSFLDITSRVSTGAEQGLLSLAFDPRYATNGFFYVFFTDLAGTLTVERYAVTADADVASPAATPVIAIPHPTFDNHNGGLVMFGPDSMLYIGTGDGGGAGDPFGNAQNSGSLLGKLLRIDVRTLPYTPRGQGREIWASGLRNPWRFDFRARTDAPLQADLYIADVGQDLFEEIDLAILNPSAINYGWNRMEGNACYPAGTSCNSAGLERPVLVYDHTDGSCSIVGGFVYRGAAIPGIADQYFYSDYCSGFLASITGGAPPVSSRRWSVPDIGNVLSFGEDAAGEMYMLSEQGRVYRIVARR